MGEVINLTDDDSTEGVPEGEVVKKTQKRSFVWTYFDKDAAKSTSKGGETRLMVTCLARKGKIGGKYVSKYKCGDELSTLNPTTVSNLKTHLKNAHGITKDTALLESQVSIQHHP